MGTHVTSWFLRSIDFSDAPGSLTELASRFKPIVVDSDDLLHNPKWEPILRGDVVEIPPGWAPLASLAETRRGIATGSNSFFLVSAEQANAEGILSEHLRPCVGRANDVRFPVFRTTDFESLLKRGARCLLIDLDRKLSENEERYVQTGEGQGLSRRYLLANRKPWYLMEQRPAASIWASVFSRGELVFVFNEAKVRSLTNFHCVFPTVPSDAFAKALVVLLNSDAVRVRSKLVQRGFGGGLNKFEPRDLLGIPVPDLRYANDEIIKSLAAQLDRVDHAARGGDDVTRTAAETERLISLVAHEASPHRQDLFQTC